MRLLAELTAILKCIYKRLSDPLLDM